MMQLVVLRCVWVLGLMLVSVSGLPLLASVDLHVAADNLVLRPAGPYEANQSIVIYVAARNNGDQDADAWLKLECVETGEILIEQRLHFPAALFNTAERGWVVPGAGILTLRLSVNPDRSVAETDYGNNVTEKQIVVRGPAPPPASTLGITRINILPEQPSPGNPVLIQVEVSNTGQQEQRFNVFVFFRRPGATGESVAAFSQQQTLPAGRQRIVEMTWQPPNFSPIPIRIEIQQNGKAVALVSRTLMLAMADLSITGFSMTPKIPDTTTQPQLDVEVGNTGASVCRVWLLVKEVGRAEIGRQLVTVPARGKAVARMTLPRRPAGRYELMLELNTQLAGATPVREADLANNQARMFWVVAAASDASFGRIIVADARDYEIWSECRAQRGESACRGLYPAEDVQVAEPLAFEIQVWNRGSGRGRFTGLIRLTEEGSRDPGSAIAEFSTGLLDPGRSDVAYVRWTPQRTGRFQLVFDLDPQNLIAETDERNNRHVASLRVHHRLETGVLYVGQREEVAFPSATFAQQSWRNNQRSDTTASGVRFKVWESTGANRRSTQVSFLEGAAYTTFEVREGEQGERRGRADLEINLALLGFMEHVDPEVPVIGLAVGASSFELVARVRLYLSPGTGSLSRNSVILAERPLLTASVERDWTAEFLWNLIDIKNIKSTTDALGELVFVDQVVPWRGYVVLPDVLLEAGRRYHVAVYFRAECRANGVGAKAGINFMDREKVGDEEGRQLYRDDSRGIFFNHIQAVWKSVER